jgi:hypothetical protein
MGRTYSTIPCVEVYNTYLLGYSNPATGKFELRALSCVLALVLVTSKKTGKN